MVQKKDFMKLSQIRRAVSVSCGFSANISTISGFLHIFRRKGSPGKGADTMHIFTQMKNFKVFDAVDKSQSVPDSRPYRADVMPVFFRILYTSGMRVSELRLANLISTSEKDISLFTMLKIIKSGMSPYPSFTYRQMQGIKRKYPCPFIR